MYGLVVCRSEVFFRTSSVAAPTICTSKSAFCFILRNFAFGRQVRRPPYGPWEHVPPHVY